MSKRDPRWWESLTLVWLTLPAALMGIAFALLPLRSWDYWWHIAVGRLIARWNAVPTENHFLYTMPADAPSFVQPWLAQRILFHLHDLGGLEVTLLLRNFIVIAVFGVLTVVAARRARDPMLASILALVVGGGLAHWYLELRTSLLAWPLFTALLLTGYAVRSGRIPRWSVVAYPLSAALWANLHGSFVMPALFCFTFAVASLLDGRIGERERDARGAAWWGGAMLASLAATGLNPRGYAVFGYLADVATNEAIQQTVTEWQPTTLTHPEVAGPVFYALLAVAAVAMFRNRSKLDPADLLFVAGFAVMTIRETRAMLWFCVAYVVCVSPSLAGLLPEREVTRSRVVAWLATAILLGAALGLQPWSNEQGEWVAELEPTPVRKKYPLLGRVPAQTPVEAVEVLKSWGSQPRVFHDLRYAGYILYELGRAEPEQLVFVDHRIELPPSQIWDLYELTVDGNVWAGVFQQYGVRAAVLDKAKQAKLASQMRQHPDWEVGHETDDVVLFIHR